MENESFGSRLRQLRTKMGLTQPELANGITSASHISLIEAGKRQPSEEIVSKLAMRLSVSVGLLKDGPDSSSNQARRKDFLFAEMALKNGDAEFAANLIRKYLNELIGTTDSEFEVKSRYLLAQSLEMLGDLENAKSELQKAIAIADGAGLPLQVIEMTIDLSRYARQAGDFVTALELVEAAQKRVPLELQNSATYARLLSSAIAIHYLRGDYIRAFDLSSSALEIFDEKTSPQARASILWNASVSADAMQDTATALMLAQRAAGLFSEADDSRAEGRLRVTIAWLFNRQSPPDVKEARAQLFRAAQLLVESGTAVDISNMNIEQARVEWLSGNYEGALEISTSALDRMGSDHDRLQRAEAYLLVARSQISLGKVVESSMNLSAARTSLSSMEPSRQNALAWRELGDIYSGLEYLNEAIAAYREALHDAGVPASPIAFSEAERAKEDVLLRGLENN
ncbi:MAG: helix-turn-helix transcriptional regulator [Actinomycetes bacterium]